MRARRTFDEKFKRQVIESVLSGSVSQVELALKYTISPLLI
ncbi:MAG: transposase [Candidatus Humimicrobiaceae bacterium]